MRDNQWLKNNIRSILAIMWSIAGISIFLYGMFSDKSNENLRGQIISLIQAIVMFTLGYYYSDSKSKNDTAGTVTNKVELTETKKDTTTE